MTRPESEPNKLYTLSEEPQKALGEIRAAYPGDSKGKRPQLREAVENLLTTDDYVEPDVVANIGGAYGESESDPGIRGPLGLYLSLNTATELALSVRPDGEQRRQIEAMLREPPTADCFRKFFKIKNDYNLENARLHRIGTTSLILRCPLSDHGGTPQVVALKCLLPRYHRVKAIRERTKNYKKRHSIESPVAPCVIESTALTIAMEFVEGETLAERFEARVKRRQASGKTEAERRALYDADVKFVREVGLEICRALEAIAAEGHTHLDLSPSNIIVVSDERDYRLRIKLIDFGQNFAITERVGSAAAYRQAALYVAPELIHGKAKESWRCDAYSLGVILLEAAALTELRKEDLASELERLWQGERPWEGAPQIGRIVDELLDEDMDQRLALYAGDGEEEEEEANAAQPAYEYLQKLIRQETEVLEHYEDQTNGSGFGLLHGFGLVRVYRNTQVVNILRTARANEESVDDTYADFPALARWAIASMAVWALAVGAFVMMTLADFGWKTVEPWAEELAGIFGNPELVGEWDRNLPGRLVALTFALTAVTYYINNLATLSPKRIGRRIGWMSEVLMRSTSFIFVFPILFVLLCDPHIWPWVGGPAALFLAWNNYVALRIGARAFDVFQGHFTPKGNAGYKFITEVFTEWWVLMFWYGVALIAVGVVADFEKLSTEGLLAGLVVTANFVKLYRTNCVRDAPQVRGCLSRALLTLRRANRRFDDREIREPAVSSPRRFPLAAVSRWWWGRPQRPRWRTPLSSQPR